MWKLRADEPEILSLKHYQCSGSPLTGLLQLSLWGFSIVHDVGSVQSQKPVCSILYLLQQQTALNKMNPNPMPQ